jgi:hypothetical protein
MQSKEERYTDICTYRLPRSAGMQSNPQQLTILNFFSDLRGRGKGKGVMKDASERTTGCNDQEKKARN